MVLRKNIPISLPKAKSMMQMIVYHLVKVLDPVTKMDSQARFKLDVVNLTSDWSARFIVYDS